MTLMEKARKADAVKLAKDKARRAAGLPTDAEIKRMTHAEKQALAKSLEKLNDTAKTKPAACKMVAKPTAKTMMKL